LAAVAATAETVIASEAKQSKGRKGRMDCFASLAMTTNSAYFRQPHLEPNSQEQHCRTLAKAGTKRLEGRTLRAGTSFIHRKNCRNIP
jgi:hypothetical protein